MAGPAAAQGAQFRDSEDGISCSYFDVRLGVKWRSLKPEWVDRAGRPNGPHAIATQTLPREGAPNVVRFDVLEAVRAIRSGQRRHDGFLVRAEGVPVLEFHSREADEIHVRPQLLLRYRDGRSRYLEPVADATLDCSTYKGLGRADSLRFVRDNVLAIRFDPKAIGQSDVLDGAELLLVRKGAAPQATARLSVFELSPPFATDRTVRTDGIASQFPADQGIASHPDVVFSDDFDSGAPDHRWLTGPAVPAVVVRSDPGRDFVPLAGAALRVTIPKKQLLGLDYRYRFRLHRAQEPEEIYFRYYLRLSRDWLGAADAGKLPGLAGTYGRAGWGGRKWDGQAGWSLRGAYGLGFREGSSGEGRVMLSTYAYHAGSDSRYGESLAWADGDIAGLIPTDTWVCIEQHLRLNTPGQHDGLLEIWVDGRRALLRKDLRLRDRPDIRIEDVWMNFYHGGTQPAPADMHAFVDQVVVASRYIGPMAPRRTGPGS